MAMDVVSQSHLVSWSSYNEEKSYKTKFLNASNLYGVRECILESVLNDLHSSAKVSLVQYLENLVDEEVRKVVHISNDTFKDEVLATSYSST